MKIEEHYQRKLKDYKVELDMEESESDLAEVIRLAKLCGWLRGYADRDSAYSEPTA